MRRSDDKGVWTLFIAGAKEGDMYKYRITQATGRVVDKMDPYAFYSELRPNTASIVTNLEYKNGAMANGSQKEIRTLQNQ